MYRATFCGRKIVNHKYLRLQQTAQATNDTECLAYSTDNLIDG